MVDRMSLRGVRKEIPAKIAEFQNKKSCSGQNTQRRIGNAELRTGDIPKKNAGQTVRPPCVIVFVPTILVVEADALHAEGHSQLDRPSVGLPARRQLAGRMRLVAGMRVVVVVDVTIDIRCVREN
jgi:hypothetical protein